MHTAQGKYTLAGRNLAITIYFDARAFDLLQPSLQPDAIEDFICLVCDSMAAVLPADLTEKQFYIKRITQTAQSLKLLCTDGILIDSELILSVSRQAYPKERIVISQTSQLPAQFNLNDVSNQINKRLPAFEEEVHRHTRIEKRLPEKETISEEKWAPSIARVDEQPSHTLTELGNIKKEIREICLHTMMQLKTQSQNPALSADEKNAFLKKTTEMAEIPRQFDKRYTEAAELINQKRQILTTIQEIIIHALYQSAKEFQQLILPKIQQATLFNKKTIIQDFNKKFLHIATLSENGDISSEDAAYRLLQSLTLESLQEVISKEDKQYPGLLQKCNTSWNEESPELKIVIKKLGQLNQTISEIFQKDSHFSSWANQEMTRVTRISFPRSFQFKFTPQFNEFKKTIDNFCQAQTNEVQKTAQYYKKVMQLNDLEYTPTRFDIPETIKTSTVTSSAASKTTPIDTATTVSATTTITANPVNSVAASTISDNATIEVISSEPIKENILDTLNQQLLSSLTLELNEQRAEAKNLLLLFVQRKGHQDPANEQIKQSLLESWTHLDTNIIAAEKLIAELSVELQKISLATHKSDSKIRSIEQKWEILSALKSEIQNNFFQLKKVNLQSMKN